MLISIFLLSLVAQTMCQMNFTGHKVLTLIPSNEKEVEFMKDLVENVNIDTWMFRAAPNERTNIRVSPEIASNLEKTLKSKDIAFYVNTDNLQKWIDEEREENPADTALAGRQEDFPLDSYHTFEAIMSHLDSLESRYNGLAEVQQVGTTYEGNPIKVLKIGTPREDKPAIWIDSGIHAREWVAPATSLYFIEQLVKGYDTDAEIKGYLDTYDWYILPVANPDGYKYTWTTNRMWRKNRSPSFALNPFCRGTDPNRNFDAHFGGPGTSNNPCSEIYRGSSAFSEAESQAIRDGVLKLGDRLKVYMTIHAYSQLYMSPYGTSKKLPPDHEDHMRAMEAATNAIRNVHGENYKHGTISNIIYSAAGSSTDWAYAGANIKYSFATELRDTGRHGFILPKELILPTAEENFAGFRALLDTIHSEISQ